MSEIATATAEEVAVEPSVPAELVPIARLCAGRVRYFEEGGLKYIHMEELRFLVRGEEKHMDALLCLNWRNNTYPTRLFLAANLGLGLNWHESAYLIGRHWFTWSWKDVPANQPPISILANHLKALQ